mmetsp:Transcript_62149/g.187505  ORF Transcript_62149/g.187505 Transcript_62149/m.187505 type:complete len:276 (+) Transcript_62149:380-1207(+)
MASPSRALGLQPRAVRCRVLVQNRRGCPLSKQRQDRRLLEARWAAPVLRVPEEFPFRATGLCPSSPQAGRRLMAAPRSQCWMTTSSRTWARGRTLLTPAPPAPTTTSSTWRSTCLGRPCDSPWTCPERAAAAMPPSTWCPCGRTHRSRTATTTTATPTTSAACPAPRSTSWRLTSLRGTPLCTPPTTTTALAAASVVGRATMGHAIGVRHSTLQAPSASTPPNLSTSRLPSRLTRRAYCRRCRLRSRRTATPAPSRRESAIMMAWPSSLRPSRRA